ncbi:MAG TPA: sodium:proton antiporter [Caulobacterales bacterium]|nr:sodium:proton antiporter [Caulobacterales bacterium]
MHAYALSPFDAAAILITLAALLAWVNARFFKLPTSVGLALMGVIASVFVIVIDNLLPNGHLAETARSFLDNVDFQHALLNGMLCFLLFAGALHVDLNALKQGRLQVALLSTLGVIVSALLVGYGLNLLTRWLGAELPLPWCFVFGALISPTDPVAVLGVMKSANTTRTLQAMVSGESLFNDGVGIVVFTIFLASAASGHEMNGVEFGESFIVDAIGGAALGIAVGYIAYWLMRAIEDYSVELLITLAVVMGGYSLASVLHISGPVAMAAAGLLIGNHGFKDAMTEETRDYIVKFWALLDEVLNAVLFLLIGLLGVALLAGDPTRLLVGALAVPLVMAARAISVGAPLLFWSKLFPFGSTFGVLVWGGLRGGISIAMALSLPAGPTKELIVTATYVVVLFSVLVQGVTVQRIMPKPTDPEPSARESAA